MLQKYRFINAQEWNHITAEVVEGCHWMQAPTLALCCRNGGAASKGKTIDLYIHSECLFLWKIRVVPVYVHVCVVYVCLAMCIICTVCVCLMHTVYLCTCTYLTMYSVLTCTRLARDLDVCKDVKHTCWQDSYFFC